jgi:Uma2 family endonuclease
MHPFFIIFVTMGEPKIKYYPVEQYLALETEDGTRYEYHNGELYAMAGASLRHNEIALNCASILKAQTQCKVYALDVKLKVNLENIYLYPDVLLSCAKGKQQHYAIEPIIIIEILSESTEAYDRQEKMRLYQQIPTLKYYILVAQSHPLVEVYTRMVPFWRYDSYNVQDAPFALRDGEATFDLNQIYEGIEWE